MTGILALVICNTQSGICYWKTKALVLPLKPYMHIWFLQAKLRPFCQSFIPNLVLLKTKAILPLTYMQSGFCRKLRPFCQSLIPNLVLLKTNAILPLTYTCNLVLQKTKAILPVTYTQSGFTED